MLQHVDFTSGVVTAAALVVNFIWSGLNLRMQANLVNKIKAECPSRVECLATHRVCDEKLAEICRRLDRAGA